MTDIHANGWILLLRATLPLTLWFPANADGQLLQAGLAGWPHIGVQAGYIDLHTMYTLETVVQADIDAFASRQALHVAGGVGVSILPLSIWRAIGQVDYGYDLDLGIRFGPRLHFVEHPTRDDKNEQFSLFIDPFLRFRKHWDSLGHAFYLEIGSTRPIIRTGFQIGI